MLYKVFDFADKEVHEVMVPRPEVVAIKADLPPEEALAALLESPFTRYPVYRESLDEIIGVLHVRDLFAALHDRGIAQVEIEQLLRPVYIVPETKDLGALLAEFRKQNQHMAVVVDEYGAMEGIVTLEDLLEEIVGEIEDEFDLPDESVERIDDTHILIHGTFPIDDFNEQFGTEIEVEDYHTMAGIVFGEIGRAPEVGDEVTIDGLNLGVIEIEGSRIQRLEVEFREKLPEPEQEDGVAMLPIKRPGKVICVGLNYRGHAEEQGVKLPESAASLCEVADGADRPGRPDRAALDLDRGRLRGRARRGDRRAREGRRGSRTRSRRCAATSARTT